MEGAAPIRQPTEVADWYARGLRIIMPAWAQTQYAGGNGEPGPLTESGRQLLDEMSRLNMILDLSHISDQSFFEAADHYPGPLIVSHSNPRAFLPTDRGLTDDMIRTIAAKDGVIGTIPYNRYLQPGWQVGNTRLSIQTFLDAIDYIAQLVGVEHVAIGSDFDGGFGTESVPAGIDTVADLLSVTRLLADRGYSDDQIAAVAYGNWLRVLRVSFA
jgi:membrane dipeptidase